MCKFPVTRPTLQKSTDPKVFFARISKKFIEDFFENFYVPLGTRTSCICLLKSQRFAFSVTFNAMRWFNFLVNDFSLLKVD